MHDHVPYPLVHFTRRYTCLEFAFDDCPYRPRASREQEDEGVEPEQNGCREDSDVRQHQRVHIFSILARGERQLGLSWLSTLYKARISKGKYLQQIGVAARLLLCSR